MKFTVDQETCIGCGMSKATAPVVFDLNEDGKAFVLMTDVPPQFVSAAHDAFENCPVGAIMEDYKKQKN